ncbi:MAG: polysaccharide deacetylase family protein [Dehalococcoidales bacterium]|nr:polysaccharide deacetylase family protein [Dehalococcoidales bacterium]
MTSLHITLHDFQDTWDSQMQQSLIDWHLQSGIKADLAIIAGYFGDDAPLVDRVKAGVQQGIFGIYNHTWGHIDLTTLSKDEIRESILSSQQRLRNIFGLEPTIVVPPYWSINQDVIDVCAELGLQIQRMEPYTLLFPQFVDGGWAQIVPEIVREDVENTLDTYGAVEIAVHHQGIIDINLYIHAMDMCFKPEWIDTVSSIVGMSTSLLTLGLAITVIAGMLQGGENRHG